jgi:hypothetical protein
MSVEDQTPERALWIFAEEVLANLREEIEDPGAILGTLSYIIGRVVMDATKAPFHAPTVRAQVMEVVGTSVDAGLRLKVTHG